MAEPLDYETITEKLLDKTQKGRVPWKATYASDMFFCTLEGEYTFQLDKTAHIFSLTMRDKQRTHVFTVEANPKDMSGEAKAQRRYELLSELFELARRKSLDIEKKLGTASTLLDKM